MSDLVRWPWTAVELAALFRARDAIAGGYYDDYDDHGAPGTRHLCHLRLRPPPPPSLTAQVLRGIGLR